MFKKVLFGIIGVIIVGGVLFWIFGPKDAPTSFLTVSRKDIAEEVAVTGQLAAKESLDLSFELGGKVAQVYVKVGQKVSAGTLLLALDPTELNAQIQQANAAVSAARAEMNQASAVLRDERRSWRNFDETPPGVELDNVYRSTIDVVSEAYRKSYDAVYTLTGELFSGPSYDPFAYEYVNFSTSNSSLASRVQEERYRAKESLQRMEGERTVNAAISYAQDVELYVEDLAMLLEYTDDLSSTLAGSYKTAVSNARASVAASLSSLRTHSQRVDLQESVTTDRGDTQELSLRQAETAVQTRSSQLDRAMQDLVIAQSRGAKILLRSPGAFIVTKIEREKNELAQAYAPVIRLMAPGQFMVEANVPEVDISAISVGNKVAVTFDALGDKNFTGEVVAIEPAETVIDGVVSYQVTITLKETDERLRSGFTSNIRVQTRLRDDVLVVPSVALLEKDEGTFVKVLREGEEREVSVVTGATDSEGMVEIISGLNEGEQVLNVGIVQQ